MDVNASVRLQLVRGRFIDGQAECSLRRHLDSVGQTLRLRTLWIDAEFGRVMRRTQASGKLAANRTILGRSARWLVWIPS